MMEQPGIEFVSAEHGPAMAVLPRNTPPCVGLGTPLTHSGFRRFLCGTAFYHLGIWIFVISVSWQITTLSRSAAIAALIQTCLNLPVLLLALPAGKLIDRLSRKETLIAALILCIAIAAAGSVATSHLASSYAGLLLLTLGSGITFALAMPAWNAWGASLVRPAEILSASLLMNLSHSLMRALGYSVGGLAMERLTFSVCLWLANFSLLIAVVCFLVVPRGARSTRQERISQERPLSTPRDWLIRRLCQSAGVISLGTSTVWALLPAVLSASLSRPTDFGIVMACFGLGAMGGLGLVEVLHRRLSTRRTLLFAVAMLGGAIAAIPLCVSNLELGSAIAAIGGSWTIVNAMLLGTCLRSAQGAKSASSAGLYLSFSYAGFVIGSLLSGAVADWIGGFVLVFCGSAAVVEIGAISLAAIPGGAWEGPDG